MGDPSNLVLTWRTVMMAMVCLPILISALLLLFKKLEQTPSRFLGAVLFATVLIQVPQIIGFANAYRVWPELTFFPFATDFWLGPLIYLHAFTLLKNEALGWRKWLLAPGILQSTYYTWAFLFLGDYKNKWAFTGNFHDPFIVPVESILGILMMILSLYFVARMYKDYKEFINNTESSAIEFDPIWLKRLIVILLVATALYSLLKLLEIFIDLSYTAAFPLQVLIMLAIAWLSIEAVWRISLPFPKMDKTASAFSNSDLHDTGSGTRSAANEASASEQSPIKQQSNQEIKTKAEEIQRSVIQEKWFLEPRFSLKQLSAHMASNEVYISRAINQGLKKSFNDFINGLRVEHAKHLLSSSDLPLLTIALESGFNSKATFNRVFKDLCQVTPSQYKKKGLKT